MYSLLLKISYSCSKSKLCFLKYLILLFVKNWNSFFAKIYRSEQKEHISNYTFQSFVFILGLQPRPPVSKAFLLKFQKWISFIPVKSESGGVAC